MNKLSSCKLFEMVDKSFKGSLLKTLVEVSKNINKYIIDFNNYDYIVKSMRTYKYPLSKLIVKSTLLGEIKPILLADPKNEKDKQIFLPSAMPTFNTVDNKYGYVDISPRAGYIRNKLKQIEVLKVKEIDLYAYLNMAFNNLYLNRYSSIINKSHIVNVNIATAYSRLFSRCVDRTYPISASLEKFNVSIYLSAVFCLVQFFDYSIKDASNIVFSSKISNKAEIESDCKVLKEGKLNFKDIEEFLSLYNYEFSDYIKRNSLNLRMMVNMFQKMYGANSWFALEHSITFFNMILATPIGLFNDKFISKTIKAQVDKVNNALVTIFSVN